MRGAGMLDTVVQPPITIRDAIEGDGPSLAALERSAPDQGELIVRVDPVIDYFSLASRYPGVRGYVAVAHPADHVVGMLFSSVTPTQLNGQVVPGAYLFSLRVHPAARRRGIGSALIEHAWQRARSEAGVQVAWAGVMAGNSASLRTLARAGFVRLRDLAIRTVIPLPGLHPPERAEGWTARSATPADIPQLVELLNGAHAGHNLWRPRTRETLMDELTAARHSMDDVYLVLDSDRTIVAAAITFDVGRTAHLRLLGLRVLPKRLNRLLAALASPIPIRVLLIRYGLLSSAYPTLIRSIRRTFGAPLSPIAIVLDRRDPAWAEVARVSGFTRRLHVVTRSLGEIDPWRPLSFT